MDSIQYEEHQQDIAAYVAELKEELAQTRWLLNASQRIAAIGSWQIIMKDSETAPGSHQWSDEVFRLLGYEPGEVPVSNDLFFSHLHPDDVVMVEEALAQSIQHCKQYDIVHRLIRTDGRQLLVHERGEVKCLYGKEEEKWVQLIGTMQDITDRRKTDNYEASLKSIFDNTSLAYILLDEHLDIVGFNKAAHSSGIALLGMELREGENIMQFTEPARRQQVQSLYDSIVQGGKHSYEHCFTVADGGELWTQISLFPIHLARSKVMGMCIAIENITERKVSDETIRAKRAKYKSFFLNSPDALLITKCDGPILEANPAACALFGMSEDELRSIDPHSLVDTEHPDFRRLLGQRQRTGRARGELTFIRKDASRFSGIITSVLYADAHGEMRTSMSVHDITDRKEAEEKLRRTAFELRRVMDQLNTFREDERTTIAREIHDELGQQLSTLKLGVRRVSAKLQQHELADDITISLLGEIDEAIKSVRRIASNLRPIILDYEGLTAALKWYASGFEKLHSIPVSLTMDMPFEIDDKKIAITLFRVLQETFTNIIRHANATQITVNMHMEDEAISLTIIDNGVGIDTEKASQKKTFGLIGMKERVALVGGDYYIARHCSAGTITKVSVPYTPAAV